MNPNRHIGPRDPHPNISGYTSRTQIARKLGQTNEAIAYKEDKADEHGVDSKFGKLFTSDQVERIIGACDVPDTITGPDGAIKMLATETSGWIGYNGHYVTEIVRKEIVSGEKVGRRTYADLQALIDYRDR